MERIQLSNASFEGDNNVYLFDGTETVLVDTGDWTAETRVTLSAALADRGLAFADVDRVFLTHWHGDHVGLAGHIQRAGGAAVHVHEADAPLVAGVPTAWAGLHETYEERFEHWQVPTAERETLRAVLEEGPDRTGAPEVRSFRDGDTFTVDGEPMTVSHGPGHAAGSCLFARGEDLLTGDAVLPRYTPNVGGADVRVERPLAQYLETLRDVADSTYERGLPGHRDPMPDPAGRAAEIRTHHAERAWRVLDALSRLGPTDVWTLSADLFGDLAGIHILHGPGEVYAHLTHLRDDGAVLRDGDRYRLADGVAERLGTTTAQRWELG